MDEFVCLWCGRVLEDREALDGGECGGCEEKLNAISVYPPPKPLPLSIEEVKAELAGQATRR